MLIERLTNVSEWFSVAGLVRGLYPKHKQSPEEITTPARWIRTVHDLGGKIQTDYDSEANRFHPLLTLTRNAEGTCRFNALNSESNELSVMYLVAGDDMVIPCMDGKSFDAVYKKKARQFFMQVRPEFFGLTRVFPETTGLVTRAYSLLVNYRV